VFRKLSHKKASLKVAILTRPDFRSPRVLADSLKDHLERQGAEVEVFYGIDVLNRLVSLKRSGLSIHFWLTKKMKNYFNDKRLLKKLKKFDTIIISECIPNAFLSKMYNIEKFKKMIKKPVGLYEVYYLENAPTQIDFLKKDKNGLSEKYDFHLSVAEVTEIKKTTVRNWYPIGLKSEFWNLKPLPKKEIFAIVDFVQPGYEMIRETQIKALNKAEIKYIALDRTYTFAEVRNIYQEAAIFFIQFPEAFGVSILECLCCGCQIFTVRSAWPMSWRLNENPAIHGEGILPDCFTIYQDEVQLVKELIAFKSNYDLKESPKKVFDNFLAHYPHYYYGNEAEMSRLVTDLKSTVH
jgi:hypothetical protein